MALQFERAAWPAPKNINALTTMRAGGVSAAPYDSLNLGAHVDDKPGLVADNRQRLMTELVLPNEPHWLNQIHSTLVVDLDVGDSAAVADGALTTKRSVVCAVLTADCLPLFLCDRSGTQVALLHAGWRGMADGIIEVGVSAMNCDPSDVIAWAGPCISAERFEIGPEVQAALGGTAQAYKASATPGKLLANLYALAGQRLASLGVTHYTHSQACTYQDEDKFFSYRRDGECGRMASLIWMD